MAERLDRSRDDRRALLADVTHELRTPLTVITGGLEAMVDGVHPFDEDHVVPILAETRVMDRLLDDLRTLSLADAGALALHREPADLRAIADEVVASSTPLASARGVTLRAGGDGRLVTSVDPVRVREILSNLVANALRHTPTGGLHLPWRSARTASEAVLTVTDTGDGIAAAELAAGLRPLPAPGGLRRQRPGPDDRAGPGRGPRRERGGGERGRPGPGLDVHGEAPPAGLTTRGRSVGARTARGDGALRPGSGDAAGNDPEPGHDHARDGHRGRQEQQHVRRCNGGLVARACDAHRLTRGRGRRSGGDGRRGR